jgi:hypothetical protein
MDTQTWENLYTYFNEEAEINWVNTNEKFTVQEFVRLNSEYPGDWRIELQRMEATDSSVVSVVKVKLKDQEVSVHGVSFFEFSHGKIVLLTEYWGDDTVPPQWRTDKQIGTPMERGKS